MAGGAFRREARATACDLTLFEAEKVAGDTGVRAEADNLVAGVVFCRWDEPLEVAAAGTLV